MQKWISLKTNVTNMVSVKIKMSIIYFIVYFDVNNLRIFDGFIMILDTRIVVCVWYIKNIRFFM